MDVKSTVKNFSFKTQVYFILVVSIFFSSCAKPRYENESSFGGGASGLGSIDQQLVGFCKLPFRELDLCLALVWEDIPTDTTYGSMIIHVFSGRGEDASLVDLQHDLDVELTMPGMNHPNPAMKIEALGRGTYRVSEVFYIMRGLFNFHFHAKDGDQVVDEVIYEFTF